MSNEKETVKELNRIFKEMMGKPMTKEQLQFQEELRAKVKAKEITVEEAHKIWNEKYEPSKKVVKEEVPFEQRPCCENCKFWDHEKVRDFKRFGIREGLVERRSICRNKGIVTGGHLVKFDSEKPCFEKGTYKAPEPEVKVKEPEVKEVVKPVGVKKEEPKVAPEKKVKKEKRKNSEK